MLHNLDQLRAFVAAAECGSFSAAARRLQRAQSVVSTHIAMLEADLGLELFDRGGRTPTLTQAGQALLVEASEVLRQCGQFETLAMALCDGAEADLRLALDEGLPHAQMSTLCSALAAHFPHLKVQLLYGATAEVSRWVEHETVHLGVAFDDPVLDSIFLAGTVERHGLGRVEQVLVAAKKHPLASMKPITRRDLARHRQIVIRFALESGRDPYVLSPSVWETNSAYAAVDLAQQGIGWAIVPSAVADYSALSLPQNETPEGLTVLEYKAGVPSLSILLLWKGGHPFTPVMVWLREQLIELFTEPSTSRLNGE